MLLCRKLSQKQRSLVKIPSKNERFKWTTHFNSKHTNIRVHQNQGRVSEAISRPDNKDTMTLPSFCRESSSFLQLRKA